MEGKLLFEEDSHALPHKPYVGRPMPADVDSSLPFYHSSSTEPLLVLPPSSKGSRKPTAAAPRLLGCSAGAAAWGCCRLFLWTLCLLWAVQIQNKRR